MNEAQEPSEAHAGERNAHPLDDGRRPGREQA